MVGKGVKRKRHAEGGLDPSFQKLADCPQSYSLKRQLVLNTSLNKMQSGRALPELSLRRTVLIANTLRQIQEEMRVESSQLASTMDLEGCGGAELGTAREPPPSRLSTESYPDGLDDYMPLASDEDFSLSSAINSILRDLDIVIDGSPSLSPPPDDEAAEPMELAAEDEDGAQPSGQHRPLESVFGSFEIMSSSYLVGVTLDDLFLDIDTSLCECEAPSTVLTTGGRATAPSPADDSTKSFPSLLGNNPSLRTDLNDLDHIMEILVSS